MLEACARDACLLLGRKGSSCAEGCLYLANTCVLSCSLATRHALERGTWISISLFIRGVNTPV